ncbi:exostosin-like 3 [Galendromus occidentalis]|uniref:glucuronosyl-galactosyl-proteoglycan 4-alpha-N-acetylglucosaminyltransferase n=1 Tax=Galendromus occidentalis TaxID=34638 RepID=A0AAJ6QX28_9ACAR|nr:exostosin-like 3 [Galendromus occidentalis]
MRLYTHTTRCYRVAAAVGVLTICGVLLPLLVMSYLDRKTFPPAKPQELTTLSENERIRLSVRGEKMDLEKKRTNIKLEMENLQLEGETAKENITRKRSDLQRLTEMMSTQKRLRRIAEEAPEGMLSEPLGLPDLGEERSQHVNHGKFRPCTYDECFDYSRCSLRKHFRAFFYSLEEDQLVGVPRMTISELSRAIRSNRHSTPNADEACIFVVFVSAKLKAPNLPALKYWNGDGANHLVVVVDNCTRSNCDHRIPSVESRAIYARQIFPAEQFRDDFDIVLPPLQWKSDPLSYMLPVRRQNTLTFSGTYVRSENEEAAGMRLTSRYIYEEILKNAQYATQSREFCSSRSLGRVQELRGAWVDCEDSRTEPLSESIFALMIAPDEDCFVSTDILSSRLIRAIWHGAIPVILGDSVRLPFDSLLQWRKAVIMVAKARVPEIPLILRTYNDEDIFALRRQGRRLVETYFKTADQFIETLISAVRYKVKVQAFPERSQKTEIVPNLDFGPMNQQLSSETDEALGPLETPYPSLAFQRNFSLTLNYWRDLFNVHFHPHSMSAWRPTDPVLPSDAKFRGSSFGFRPIGFGAGGSGKEFAEALGGNYPREQFTAVVLTYDRPQVLIEGISNFKGLPYLSKVLVVWNGPDSPGPETLTWPEIGVPIQVVKAPVNSLNNRFVPWDAIETEAVLSLDDDARLRHDELIFAFRVWRENRDRVVGFPGRFHAYDSVHRQWNYNSNHSCELSMVLTGAAFFHKFYMYEYTYRMAPEIRQTVDDLMNCEDIALNFLVAHLTRKTPLKVTSKWTFRCPGCPVALSEHDSHFLERHDCINKFSQLYGYNPLLYTQLRADSVLFKTRVPHDRQKCFKFI